MKVAIVHSYYSSRQPSGENIVVDAQAAALRENDIDVQVIGARTDDLESGSGYKLRSAVTVATGRGRSPLSKLEAFQPDIVHVHNLFPNWGTSWLRQWSGPMITTLHNFRPVCAAGTLFRNGETCTLCPDKGSINAVRHACYRDSAVASLPLAIRNRGGAPHDPLLSRTDRIVVLSERARALYEGFGLPAAKMVVIPNFVDDELFEPKTPPGADWVYIGRLSEEKGIRGLLEHWPAAQTLNVYGDGPLRADVEVAATEGRGIRYGGELPRNQVPHALASAIGLVFPSEWPEGFPTIYAEALAAGRAVVAKANNSASDDVVSAGTGRVFEDWSDFQDTIMDASKWAAAIAPISRKHFESTFTREVWLQRALREYETLTGIRE